MDKKYIFFNNTFFALTVITPMQFEIGTNLLRSQRSARKSILGPRHCANRGIKMLPDQVLVGMLPILYVQSYQGSEGMSGICRFEFVKVVKVCQAYVGLNLSR